MMAHLLCLFILFHTCRATEVLSRPNQALEPTTGTMQALGENINCVGVKLTSETRNSLKDCIKICIKDAACKFVTWLQKRRLCETRETCEEFVPLIMPDPQEKVLLYMKRTDCDVQLGLDGQGRYIQLISAEFPENAVRSKNPKRNIWCRCVAAHLMICGIFLHDGSEIESIVRKRLDRSDPEKLQPFFVLTSLYGDPHHMPMFFEPLNTDREETVSAEIELMSLKSCIPISMCVQGGQGPICPVTKRHIQAGDPVYLLKNDAPTIGKMKAKSILCISVSGLRKLILTEEFMLHGGFAEPFKRIKGRLVTIPKDYKMYFAFSNEQLAEGVCANQSPTMENFPMMSFAEEQVNPVQDMLTKMGITPGESSSHASSPVTFTATSFRERPGSNPISKVIVHPPEEPPPPVQHTAQAGDFRASRLAPPIKTKPSKSPTATPTVMPLPEIGTEQMVIGLLDEPGQQGMTGHVIERHVESHKVTIRSETGEEITTIPENLVGKEDLQRMLNEVDEEDAKLPDDENPVYPKVGKIYVIKGLVGKRELNGVLAKVLSIDEGRKRVAVRLRDGDLSGEVVNVKPKHLISEQLLGAYIHQKANQAVERLMRERLNQLPIFHFIKPTQTSAANNEQDFISFFFWAFLLFTLFSFLHYKQSLNKTFYIEFEDSGTRLA